MLMLVDVGEGDVGDLCWCLKEVEREKRNLEMGEEVVGKWETTSRVIGLSSK